MSDKDVIKVPLSKLKPGTQTLNSVAVDFVHEINKPGATEKQIKAEMVGSGIASGFGIVSEYSWKNSTIQKIFFNTVVGGSLSDKAKGIYENHDSKKQGDKQ